MNKSMVASIAAVLTATTFSVAAMDDKEMKAMDANGDGMISKSEFMKYHEAMWAKMKKNKNGMVDMKDMEMMQDGMAKDSMKGGMMKDDKMKGK